MEKIEKGIWREVEGHFPFSLGSMAICYDDSFSIFLHKNFQHISYFGELFDL